MNACVRRALSALANIVLLWCLGALPVPAKAAELGGNCCADLEERIAELEATVVHSSADFTMTGEINRSLLFWDDRRDQDVYYVGSAEINLEASHEFGNGWEASLLLVHELLTPEADTVDQTQSSEADPDSDGAETFIGIGNEKLGELNLGYANSVTDDIDNINLSHSGAAGDASVEDWNGMFFLRFRGSSDLGPLRWEDFIDGPTAGETLSLIRYTSPTLHGFTFGAAIGADDYWDVALRYSREFADVLTVKGGIGYWKNTGEEFDAEEPTEDEGWGSSIALQHVPSGLNIAFNYGTQSHTDYCVEPGAVTGRCRGDDRFYYIRGGIVRNDLTARGYTSFYGEYYRGLKDFNESDDEVLPALELNALEAVELSNSAATVWGFGVVQEVKAISAKVYLGYRHYQLDVDLINGGGSVAARQIEDFSVVMAGTLIEF